MATFGYALIGIFALGFLVTLHHLFWRRYYALESAAEEIHRVTCGDGAVVTLYRYPGDGSLGAHPVLLCCGIATNQLFMDLRPDLSLVQYLNGLGFDVWCLDPRGVGNLSKPKPLVWGDWQIHFEDFVDLDAPAAIGRVLGRTGAEKVHWVGFSQGGMIGSAVAQGPEAARLASLTLIGSPGWIKAPGPLRLVMPFLWVLALLPSVPLALLARLFAPFYTRLPFDVMVLRQENMDALAIRQLLSNAVDDIPLSLAFQASEWIDKGDITAARDDRNFTQGMGRIEAPLLAIAGEADTVAPPDSVRFVHDNASSARKAFVHLGGKSGEGSQNQPYGHCDLVLGRRAPLDVFPRVARWLADTDALSVEGLEDQAPADPGEAVATDLARISEEAGGPRDAAGDDLAAEPLEGYAVEAPAEEAEVELVEAEPVEEVVPTKIESAAARLIKVEGQLEEERQDARSVGPRRQRVRGLADRIIRREPPPGWNPTGDEPQSRKRPQRLHRAPVTSAGLDEALSLSASKVREALDSHRDGGRDD